MSEYLINVALTFSAYNPIIALCLAVVFIVYRILAVMAKKKTKAAISSDIDKQESERLKKVAMKYTERADAVKGWTFTIAPMAILLLLVISATNPAITYKHNDVDTSQTLQQEAEAYRERAERAVEQSDPISLEGALTPESEKSRAKRTDEMLNGWKNKEANEQ